VVTLRDDLTPKDIAILTVLQTAEKPIKMVTVASRAKCKNDAYFRSRMRELARKGLVRRVDDVFYEVV